MTKTETIIDTISNKSHKELCQEVLAIATPWMCSAPNGRLRY